MLYRKDIIHCCCASTLYPVQGIQWGKRNLTRFSTNFILEYFSSGPLKTLLQVTCGPRTCRWTTLTFIISRHLIRAGVIHLTKEDYGCDMKRDLHNLNLGFIQLKRNVHFDSTDHDCPEEPPRSVWAPNHARAPIAQDSSKGNQCTCRSKLSTNRIRRKHLSAHHKEVTTQHSTPLSWEQRLINMNKQTTDNICTNVTSVLRDHVSDREQVHSGRLVSFGVSIAVMQWLWYQVVVIGQQAQHVQCRQRSVTYRVDRRFKLEYHL